MQHEQEMKSAKVFYINHVDDLKPLDQPAVYPVLLMLDHAVQIMPHKLVIDDLGLKFLQRDLEKFHH